MQIQIETLTELMPKITPDLEAVHDDTKVGFYRFISGQYEGVTFTYVDPKIVPTGTDDNPEYTMSFTYVIVQDPNGNQPKNHEEDEAFKQVIGDRLTAIICAAVDE